MLEKDQKWADLVPVVFLQAELHSLPHLAQALRVVITPMNVGFRKGRHRAWLGGRVDEFFDEISLWHDESRLMVTQHEA